MPDSKAPTIPSWQQTHKSSSSALQETKSEALVPDAETGTPIKSTQSDETLLEQAGKFLKEESIKNAPIEEKRSFLESKGVRAEDIARLLDEEAKDEIPNQRVEGDEPEGKVVLDTSSRPSAPSQHAHSAPQSQASPPRPVAPPIVTYPEFLTQPTEQAPLVTVSRLVNTAYIAGGLSATIYGLSKFLVEPMVESLTSARHDFASNTHTRLDELNEKLAGMVSVDPASAKARSVVSSVAVDSDEESLNSDPTELYHRDYGTQTTPMLSRRPSATEIPTDELPPAEKVVAGHQDRLKIMTSHLNDLSSTHESNKTSSESLKKEMDTLNSYLADMRFQMPNPYIGEASYGGFSTPTGSAAKTWTAKDDAIDSLRADIRGVKGVFLSARNFPARGSR